MPVPSQILADTHCLGQWPGCHLQLHRNALLHWLILVPETEAVDLLDLPAAQRNSLLEKAAELGQWLKREFGYPKVNFAAIGNVVPQMHLHVVGRRPDDACWPAPVWGNLPTGPEYDTTQIEELQQKLMHTLQLQKPE
jgi:diadenosine tetraphosphate (Ap4A) HIT family hydrolase